RGQRGDDRLRQRAAGGGQAGGDGSGGGGHGPCLPRVPLIIHRGVPAALAALVVAVFAFDPLPFLLLPAIVLPALVVVEQLATFVPAEAVRGLADTVLVVEVRAERAGDRAQTAGQPGQVDVVQGRRGAAELEIGRARLNSSHVSIS